MRRRASRATESPPSGGAESKRSRRPHSRAPPLAWTLLVLQLGQLLPRVRRLLGARVLADQLGEGQAGVGGIAHLDEQVPLRPQRGRRLLALRVLGHHVVELGDRLVLVAPQRVAARRPVERVVREPRLLVVGGEAVQLRHRARAVLACEAVEQGQVLGALGDVEGAGGLLLAPDLLAPCVVDRGDGWTATGRRRAHWPRITEWTRRLRAQQASFSSWQRGSSLP